ncbi:FkbM family methyltransferase [Methylococcus mesophilus]|uniref:FkbM family methyltransferase n=1 Tax=Methylococcus mesophilus TaxID=2993564 RepID=UPI00224AAEFE|nr:FkbM family methyltransferase [Methylococcus mesophilus]UZR28743.1 FkbM family methyltransferase [Methylococcus mesophilus]
MLGLHPALKWAAMIPVNFLSIFRQKNLQAADQAMGEGPFHVHFRPGVDFCVCGNGAFSAIRGEMYVRDVYLGNGLLTIEDGDTVVDLGANIGNLTNLALAHGSSVRVNSVEPGLILNDSYKKSISLNDGFIERTQLVRASVGKMGAIQSSMLDVKQYKGAEWISEDELVSSTQLSKIDFLKCDIEGGEFDLLHSSSKMLQMTRKIAIEIHQSAGDVDGFIEMLVAQGFELKSIQREPDGSATVLGTRS